MPEEALKIEGNTEHGHLILSHVIHGRVVLWKCWNSDFYLGYKGSLYRGNNMSWGFNQSCSKDRKEHFQKIDHFKE